MAALANNWKLGRWLLGYSLVYYASMEIYPWLLTAYHGAEATGILAATSGVVYLANPFIFGMGNFLGPQIAHAFARGGARELHRFVVNGTYMFLCVMLPFCFIMFCWGGTGLKVMYGDKYALYGKLVGLLAIGQLASALAHPIGYGLTAMERPDAGLKSYIAALCVTLTFGWWLVKTLGPVGVAYSLLATQITASLTRWIIYRKVVRNDRTRQ